MKIGGSVEVQEYIDLGLCHTLHTSERRSFRSCRRRWNWLYRDYYYPLVTPKPLEFGVAMHEAWQVWYDPEFWDHPDHDIVQAELAKVTFNKVVKEQLANYRKLNGEPDPEKLADYYARTKLGLEMIEYYTQKVSPIIDVGFKPVAVEIPFEVSLGLWCKCESCWTKANIYYKSIGRSNENIIFNGLPVTYGGRIDMVALDEHGRLWIFDWKTTERIMDEDAEAAHLQLDDQITSYCWALWTLGRPVAGFVYHEQRKAVPQPPQRLSRSYKGRLYSTSKASPTTYSLFKQTIFENDRNALEAGLYEDYLKWLREEGIKFYQRHQIHRNHHEIQNAGKYIKLEAMDIIGSPRIYPQAGRFSCNTCAYRQPCLGVNMGEDYQYTLDTMFEKRDKHYYEEKK